MLLILISTYIPFLAQSNATHYTEFWIYDQQQNVVSLVCLRHQYSCMVYKLLYKDPKTNIYILTPNYKLELNHDIRNSFESVKHGLSWRNFHILATTYMYGINQTKRIQLLGNYTTSTLQDFSKTSFHLMYFLCNSHFPWTFDQSVSNATRCAPAWYKKQKV